MLKTTLLYLVIIVSFSSLNDVYPQQGKLDHTFNTFDDGLQGDGFDATVRTVSLQTDGKLIVGGDFLNFNGASTPYVCRLFPDGSKDTSFNLGSGINGKVYCSLVLPDGKIILGGSFTAFNGKVAYQLVRLNIDGSLDVSFNTPIAVNPGIVYGVALQTDGSVVIAGSFTKYNAITANRVARILTNGNLDTSFAIGVGASSLVEEVHIQKDGRIILGGSFTSFNGTACGKIIRLNTNGTVDATFVQGTGFDDNVAAITTQSDGKIIVGGEFLNFNGAPANKIIRLHPDGSRDASFVSGSGFSNGVVEIIKVNAAGSIMVGGSFTGTYNGTDVNRVILLDSNGVIVPGFDIGSGPGGGIVYALTEDSSNSWYVGGSFSVFDSQNQGRLAKIDVTGSLDIGYLTAGVGFDSSVLKVIALADNKTMAFGNFTKFNGISCNRIARLFDDGAIDSSFNLSGAGANNSIKSAIVQKDGKIVIAGAFTSYNGVTANRIKRILADGSADATFSVGTGFNNQVYALALQPDGKIIVAGNFTSYNGILINRIARLLSDGTLDSSFNVGAGADAIIEIVVLQPDGKILLGGQFSFFNGLSYNRVVRLHTNGSIDYGFSTGVGFDKNVYSIALQSDNKLVVGGTFLNYKGISAKKIVRLNTDGSLDSTFSTGLGFSSGEIRTILVQPDDRLLIGGTFAATYNGTAVKRMVRLLSNGIYDTTFSVNLNNTLYSICFTPSNKVMIGGNFNSVSGVTKHRVARIKLCTNSSNWNGNSWSNGIPSVERTLVFNGNYSVSETINSCSCSISSGNTVTISDGKTLGVVFEYSGAGTLILENNAALYQSEEQVHNSGIIHLKRKTTPIIKMDYTYWSSPVSNQKLFDVSPETLSDKFYSYHAINDSWWNESPANAMIAGKGYIIRGPQSFSTTAKTVYEAVFKGIPNNGRVLAPIAVAKTYNLIGNPYPSAINADSFIIANKGIIDGSIYLWTHNTAITNNQYTSDDYAVYNLLGGVGTSPALKSGVNNSKPDGKIASGQAFFVTGVNNGGNAIFDNNMRVVGQNFNFFKADTPKKLNQVEKHRIWLNLSNSQGAFKQILIGYIDGANNDYDTGFNSESLNGNQYLNFYSIIQDKKLVIQGKALPFEADEIKLGFSTVSAGSFVIKIDEVDGLLSGQDVFIEDKLNNTLFDLKTGEFSFNTEVGTFNDRFVLRYTDKALGTAAFGANENSITIAKDNMQLKIESPLENIKRITVFDLQGRKVFEKEAVNNTVFRTSNIALINQIVVVKVILTSGKVISKKLIF
ncbi:T9SS sorting signal type C domain-containing protein [Flavobacterium caseinilyticum]|uniref:T9SS sorting signal type C domain-containing protein n=1 Tax=Flavobacterium caseinilyticum TaxID=2541732 RepID=A0A4R5B1P4_9FLAO|nr:T9SS sorting signal type C domain-containing protein [Flavobacterium caseinilyticum]